MHRHGYKGRKFGRETDQRLALTRGLMCSLIKYQTIIIKFNEEVCIMKWSPDEVDEELIERGYLERKKDGTLKIKEYPWDVLGEMGYELKAIDQRLSFYYFQKIN